MRARLTVAVALTAGCFLALAALLLSRRASSLVLNGVVADNAVAAPGTFTVDVPPGSNVVTVYKQLDNAGLLPSFFELIGEAQPSAGQPVFVALPDGNTLPVAGQATTPGDAAVVSAATLDETGRLERLVDDLLVLARDESASTVEGVVPAGTLAITDVEEIAMAEARRTRRLPVDTSAVLAGRVVAQREDVARVVRHLLDNAARHGTTHVALSVVPDGTSVMITVDDDGPGVPVGERTRIFERFARLEDSRSRDAGGAGLGLAVVSVVVGRLGGTVEVIDAPTGGARFSVRLPAAEPSTGTSE